MSFDFFGRTFSFLADSSQQGKALEMLNRYIFKPEILLLSTIIAIYLLVRIIAQILKKEKLNEMLKRISPWIYLIMILGITVFNRDAGNREIRLVPDNWLAGAGRFHETNIIGFIFNVALFVPYAYLVYRWVTSCRNAWVAIAITICTSLSVETLQYILARGVTAVDDVLANVTGGLIGVGFAILVQKIKKKQKRESVE